MAANSLDIDIQKKLKHELSIDIELGNFSVGLILGASGSGKTTLARQIFGDECFAVNIDSSKPIIDQLPGGLNYDECAGILSGIGLTSVPCWIRPIGTLSNGQRARAEAALSISTSDNLVVLDEWTSVVDRTVAKVMSHCVQKFTRRREKKIVLLSCHYDVIEWLNPDWIIDCNSQKFIDRRLLRPDERQRSEKLNFTIQAISKSTWRNFSKYHYLNDQLAGGKAFYFGLFEDLNQIGFIAYTNYVPWRDKTKPMTMHANRIVIHPDYIGLGLGICLLNETISLMKIKGYSNILIKFSSQSMLKALQRDPKWICINQNRLIGLPKCSTKIGRGLHPSSIRHNVTTYTFKLI